MDEENFKSIVGSCKNLDNLIIKLSDYVVQFPEDEIGAQVYLGLLYEKKKDFPKAIDVYTKCTEFTRLLQAKVNGAAVAYASFRLIKICPPSTVDLDTMPPLIDPEESLEETTPTKESKKSWKFVNESPILFSKNFRRSHKNVPPPEDNKASKCASVQNLLN